MTAPDAFARPPVVTLDEPQRLLEPDDPDLRKAVASWQAESASPAELLRAMADRLRAFAGLGGAVHVTLRREDALAAAAGVDTVEVSVDDGPLTAALLDRASQREPASSLVIEPRFLDADERIRCAARLRALRANGRRIVVDESRTAGRTARRMAFDECGLEVDAAIVGPSLAAGRPFWAAIGLAGEDSLGDVGAEVAAHVLASLERLLDAPLDAALRQVGENVRDTFTEACRREDLRVEMVGPPQLPHLRFAGQENAEAPLIAHHFGLELAALGVRAGPDLAFGARHVGRDLELAAAFDGAAARIRTLLVEHNSYLSGGLPFVFPGGHPRLRSRGLARYRYPKLAAVEVEASPADQHVRIAFAPGELGPITSSGFYLPTRIRGDFDLRVRVKVRAWEPGPDSACLGLFVQNERSTARYYAQLMSTGNKPHERSVAAGLGGELLGRRSVDGDQLELRLTREGRRVAAWFRRTESDDWTELGSRGDAATDDVIAGAKIWSKVRCGGLICELSRLEVAAEVPEDQFPELEPRPDPRQAQSG